MPRVENVMSCPTCGQVVDLDNAPVVECSVKPSDHIVAAEQRDVRCPRCGGLVYRTLNGEPAPAGDGDDPRDTRDKPTRVQPAG